MKRVFYLVIDQLAGHWEESVRIEGTDLPPANVKGYHEQGLIPNFSQLIDNGLWVKRPWNNQRCKTVAALKYLATGTYAKPETLYNASSTWFLEAEKEMGFFEVAKRHYLDKLTVITTGNPFCKGYFYVPEIMQRIPAYYHNMAPSFRDEAVLRKLVFPWMEYFPDTWGLAHAYISGMDAITYCPSYSEAPCGRDGSKHTYMLFLDGLIEEIVQFLKTNGWWEETYIVIASDHGYHLGCTVAAEAGVKTNNWCADHPEPWDCEVWDFEKGRSTGIPSNGCRRTTFILSGGGLDEQYRGQTIEEAEIIDVIPTIAELLDVPYECQGKSILRNVPESGPK